MIEQKVIALLNTNPAISSLINGRIFPVAVRQETTFPAITYARLSSQRTYVMAGSGDWTTVLMSISIWAPDYAQARLLADAVRSTLDAYTSEEENGIELASVRDGADEYEATLDIFGCTLEAEVKFSED